MGLLRSVAVTTALLILAPFGIWSSHAQDLQLPEQSFVHEFARPGRPTITLYLWGSVGTTGVWRVEKNTDLIQLLSVAQVPGIGSEQIGTRQRFILHVYREQSGSRKEIYVEQIENLIGGGAKPPPTLQDGDILAVETETRRRLGPRLIFETLRTVSSFLSLYLLLRREF